MAVTETTTCRIQFLTEMGAADSALLDYAETVTITVPAWNFYRQAIASGITFTTTKTDATVVLNPTPGCTGTWRIKGNAGDTGVVIRNDQPCFLPIRGAAGTVVVLTSTVAGDVVEYLEI